MQRKYFGTDGIRGIANKGNMRPEIAMKLGMAAGKHFTAGDHRHRVIIGKDTRLSGYMLEPALVSGFISVGMDVILVGPMPTPAIAMLTKAMRADLGVMISASHNSFQYNGLKLFNPEGYKLSDEVELVIENMMDNVADGFFVGSEQLGRAKRLDDAPGRYIEFVKNSLPKGQTLDGLKVVIDCANGAAYSLGATILSELGAEVIAEGISPNGFNINDKCGSTYPNFIAQKVIEHNADIGISLDGDADRLVVVDEKGNVVDGDQILCLIAKTWHKQGKITGSGVVSTIMSNLGLERSIQNLGLEFYRTQVGDRYVIEEMVKRKINIGGEQSGHIILSDYVTTGDGLIAALQVLSALANAGKPASNLLNAFEPVPQILKNFHYISGPMANEKFTLFLDQVKKGNKNIRIVVRNSGTEPLLRVMLEGDNEAEINKLLDDITGKLVELKLV